MGGPAFSEVRTGAGSGDGKRNLDILSTNFVHVF